jgi:hypothetical protein
MMSKRRSVVAVALRVASLTAVVGLAASTAQGSHPKVATMQDIGTADPLVGVWRTEPVPMSRIRAAINAAHFTQADVDAFLDRLELTAAKSLRFNLHFYWYRGTTPKVEERFWDNSGPIPCCGDQGPYKLLPNTRVAITSDNPNVNKYRYVFSYRVQGKKLTLRFLSATNPGLSKKELRFDKVVMVATAAAPYARIH